MSQIELIIFDFDGVICDSEYIAAEVTTQLLIEHGVDTTLDKVLLTLVGLQADDKARALSKLICMDKIPQFMLEVKNRSRVAYYERLKTLPYVDEIIPMLTQQLCIGSNSSLESLLVKLKIIGMEPYFPKQRLYVSSLVANPKPAPDIYLHAAKTHNVKPENCLVIEDSDHGTHAAVAAGIPVIGYHAASHCYEGYEQRLTDAGALTLFKNMRELPEILKNL